MNNPSFSLREPDVVLADPEGFADRLAEFLRAHVRPDATDRDLMLMFVDRLFLGLCDDFDNEELMRGAHVEFPALSRDQVMSLRAMQAMANEAMANETKTDKAKASETTTDKAKTDEMKPAAMAATVGV